VFSVEWAEEHFSADEVIDAFLLGSPVDVIITVKHKILEFIESYKNELGFQEKLLSELSCYYYSDKAMGIRPIMAQPYSPKT